MKKILEQLEVMNSRELQYIILELMLKNKLDFNVLSRIYVEHLKTKDREKNIIISGLAIPLSQYYTDGQLSSVSKERQIFIKCKSAYNLLKSNVFHTAKIEKDLESTVKKYNYSEDENGMPNMELEKW